MSDFLYAVSLLDLRLNMENANDDDGSGSNDSTVIEGTAKTQRSRKDRVDKRKGQKGVQSRIRSAAAAHNAHVRDDSSDRSLSPPPKKKGRTKSSVIWNHCKNKDVRGRTVTYCNYCPNKSWELQGSTSTALSHVRQHHYDKLTDDERNDLMDKSKGTTSPASRLPARSPKGAAAFFSGHKISHDSKKGRELNVKLLIAMISSSVSFNILDCPEWGVFVECLSGDKYNLPSRQYMNASIVSPVFNACEKSVIDILKTQHHIAITTDIWKSFSKHSYVTLTSHIIDHTGELHNILLTTNEIKQHPSQNLHEHIGNQLVRLGLQSDIVTTNFNSSNENNIEDEAEENIDDEVDYLEQVGYYDEEEDDDQWDENRESRESRLLSDLIDLEEQRMHTSQETQMSTQLSEDATQMSQEPTQRSERDRTHARNVVQNKQKLSFVTDNAADIKKAVSTTYQWLGCAAHHVNLIVKEAFRKKLTAAHLLKKCKKIVSSINNSNNILYNVRKYQEEMDLPPKKLLQEVTTRWWSILHMLESIVATEDSTTLALRDSKKLHLILTSDEMKRVKEIIELLTCFKKKTDTFGSETDITISLIIPTFKGFKDLLQQVQVNESAMIKDMKQHMLVKLQSRYNPEQKEYLSQCAFLDPRFKKAVVFETDAFTERVKDIVLSYAELFHGTEENIENESFANTRREEPSPSTATATASASTSTTTDFDLFDDDDPSDDDTEIMNPSETIKKIKEEIQRYKTIKMTKTQKETLHVISWWKERKCEYPYLFKAVRSMLCTPATSVPSERIFSEAGYIARAKRSSISPVNLHKNLFIKRNKKYLPENIEKNFNSEQV